MVDKGDCYFHSYNLQEAILKELKVVAAPVPFLNYKRTGEMEPPLKKPNQTKPPKHINVGAVKYY